MSLDNLTQFQKVALEGEVAKAYSTAKHDAEILYRFYTILKNVPKEIIEDIKEVTRDLVDVKQELLDKVSLEAALDTVPVWLWVDKVIADIKLSITLACADTIGNVSMNKKEMQRKMLSGSFVYFCRKCAIVSPSSVIRLCERVINEECIDLGFLECTCHAVLEQVKELPLDKTVNKDIMMCSLDIRDSLSYKVETEVLDKLKDMPLFVDALNEVGKSLIKKGKIDAPESSTEQVIKVATIDLNDTKPENIRDVISNKIAEILDQQLKSDAAVKHEEKWAVYKNYRGYETTLRTFNSEKEADDFINNIEKSFPELKNSCTFSKKKVI